MAQQVAQAQQGELQPPAPAPRRRSSSRSLSRDRRWSRSAHLAVQVGHVDQPVWSQLARAAALDVALEAA